MSLRILFLCSGGGGNLRFIHEAVNQQWLQDTVICGVLTDRECGANHFSVRNNIENQVVDFDLSEQDRLLDKINQFNPDLIVTTVNKIIADKIVSAWRGKLINLHYSLLPAFGGVIGSMPARQALEYGAKFIGTTVHFVSEKVDAGTPIAQSVTPVYPADTEDQVMEYLFRCGSICLMTSIENLSRQHSAQSMTFEMVEFNGRRSYFNPAAVVPSKVKKEAFWQDIKNYTVEN